MMRRVGGVRTAAVLALVTLMGCRSTPADAPCPASPFRHAKMLVIAHAGGEGLAPGNTLAAMRASHAAGADVNDADVHITADGVLVAMHDDTVDATTDGDGFVREKTLAEIKTLDAGWSYTDAAGAHTFRGTGVTVPTIEELLTAFPGWLTSLELKDDDGPAPLELCSLLRRLGRTNDVYVSSDTDPAIERFKAACPEAITTVTDAMVPVMLAAQADGSAWCSTVPIGQPPFNPSRRPTKASLKWSHDHGLANFTWTVDDAATLRYLASIGMDGVYTRRPDIARKIVDATG
jgi:glycerophosphoryl diester phosphodiesterase